LRKARKSLKNSRGRFCAGVDDPDGKYVLAVGELQYPRLYVAPELRAPEGGVESQGECQLPIDVHAPEVGLGHVDHLVAVGIEPVGDLAQRRGLAHAGVAGQKRHAWVLQEPLEALLERGDGTIVLQLPRVLAERLRAESEVLTVHVTPPLPAARRTALVVAS